MNNISMSKLTVIKIIHTIIWFFFFAVFFYMAYAVIANKIDKYVWMGITFFSLEVIVLLVFKNNCPLTIIARRYSNSTKDNFDIYLPNWLAKNNKVIYSVFLFAFLCGLVYRILNS
jgi:hypothetical protein